MEPSSFLGYLLVRCELAIKHGLDKLSSLKVNNRAGDSNETVLKVLPRVLVDRTPFELFSVCYAVAASNR
jgi:hypothetical protein